MEETARRRRRMPLILLATAILAGGAVLAFVRDRAPAPQTATRSTIAVPEPKVPQVEAAPPEAAAVRPIEPPRFDVVRVAPDGSAVVAGTAEPGSEVTVYADSVPLVRVETDVDGNFVAIFNAEPAATPRTLSLGAAEPGGLEARSTDSVMLLPEPPTPPSAPDAARPATEVAALPADDDAATAAGTEVTPSKSADSLAATPDTEPEVAATAVIRGDSIEVVPAAGGSERVSLASISYAAAGDVTLAGVGKAGSRLRAYVDDRLATEATVGDDGRWSFALDDVDAGLYTLRIDQLSPEGKVASRVETPFQRDYPRAPLPRPGQPTPTLGEGVITVQPGNNLWTLARVHYGSGVLYTQIFTANRELIRDPDKIYPGQIFTLPELDRVE
jgi:hypothetical protein